MSHLVSFVSSCFTLLQEYCVNQNTANKVLQTLKQTNPALVEHLNVSLMTIVSTTILISEHRN